MSFDIKRIAELSKIHLSEEEQSKLSGDMEKILHYVEKLKELNTDSVEPTSHVLDLENVFRKDEMKDYQVRDEALDHAPHRDGKFFKVPKVVDKE